MASIIDRKSIAVIISKIMGFPSHGEVEELITQMFNIDWIKHDNDETTTDILEEVIDKRKKRQKKYFGKSLPEMKPKKMVSFKKRKIFFYIKQNIINEYFCEFKSGNYKITDVGESYKKHSTAMKHYNFWKNILNHDVVEFILKDETKPVLTGIKLSTKKQITKK